MALDLRSEMGANLSHNASVAVDQYAADTFVDNLIYRIAVPIVFSAIILLGSLGNLLVVYVILCKKQLRTVTNLLLLNLAVADVSFLLICGSFSVVHYAMTVWPFGDVTCRVIQYLLYVTCYVTMYTLVSVSFVRFLAIVYGNQSEFIRNRQKVIWLIVAIWVVFLVGKIPILVVHGVTYNKATDRTECIISGISDGQNLFTSFFVFAYALPLLIICSLYIMAVCHLKRTKNSMITNRPNNGVDRRAEERARHVTKVVILVVAVFAVCWLPLHIHLLVAYYSKPPASPTYKVLIVVWLCLSYTNSLLNPIIYHIFSKDFRRSFKEVICCNAPQDRTVHI